MASLKTCAFRAHLLTRRMRKPLLPFVAPLCFLTPFATAQNFVDDFDSGDINDRWLVQHNAVGSVEIAQENGEASVTASGTNANGGLASIASFDPLTDGIFVSFVITEVVGNPNANGFLVGVVDDNEIFHRNTNNFGIAAFGQEGRTASSDGFSLIVGDQNGSNLSDFILDEGEAVDMESFQDGFTVTLSADDNGWAYAIEGLLDIDGNERTFMNEGAWADAGTSFQEIFGQDDTWHVLTANQSPGEKITRFDQISLGDPKPASDPDIRVAGSLALGQLPSFPETAPGALTIRNNGEAQDLQITGATLSGPDAGRVTIDDGQLPLTIAPSGSADLTFTFNNGGDTGGFQAFLTLATNDPAPAEDSEVAIEITASVINVNGPAAHYPMDEAAGAMDMRDITGFLRAGAYSEGTTLGVEGLAGGTAMRVQDGAFASVTERSFDPDTFNEFAISLWFQADAVDATSTLIALGESGNPAFALLVAEGEISWFVDQVADLATDGAGLTPDQTHHVVVSYAQDEEVTLYVDGEAKGTSDSPAPFEIESGSVISIGTFGPLAFAGVLDDVQFYSKRLTAEDVQFLHANPGQELGTSGPTDSDGDGLSDEDEVNTHQTDPLVADTDGDGVDDGTEVALTSNPLEIDSDGGGTWDGFEVEAGTSPIDPNDDPAVWSVRTLKSRAQLGNLSAAEEVLASGDFSNEVLEQHREINFLGTGGGFGNFEEDRPFDNIEEIDLTNVDDFLVQATTQIFIETAGIYTFGFNSDDGGRVNVDGTPVAVFTGTRGAGDSLGAIQLSPGFHDVEAVMFERGGGSAFEVYWGPEPGDTSEGFDSNAHVLLTATTVQGGDSDNDQLEDAWEMAIFGDLAQDGTGDADGDGLTDLGEHDAKTDPNNKDTDGDGVDDGPEVNEHQTNPLVTDSDGDRRSDGEEINGDIKSNPLVKDTDGDGFSDGFEIDQGSDPNDGASLPDDRLGEPDVSWHALESLPTFNNFRGSDDTSDVTFRLWVDFEPTDITEDEREMLWESGGGTVGFSLVYETGNKLVLRGVGNGGNSVATVEQTLTAGQLAAGAIEVIWTFDVDNGDPDTGQTIALYLDGTLVGDDSQDMDPDWTGSNGAAFGVASTAFAAGGGNTSLNNGVDFVSGQIDLDQGLQYFFDTLFNPNGGPDPEPVSDLAIIDVRRTATAVQLDIQGDAGADVSLEYSADLSGNWQTIQANIVLTNGAATVEDVDEARLALQTGFYRARN